MKIMSLLSVLAVCSLTGVFASANPWTEKLGISPELPGDYALVQAEGKYATDYCANLVRVVADDEGVVIYSPVEATVGSTHASFHIDQAGCHYISRSDADANQTRCTQFHGRTVSTSNTMFSVLSAGYARETESIQLERFNSNVLVYEKEITQVPFGFTGLWDGKEFECKYQRITK